MGMACIASGRSPGRSGGGTGAPSAGGGGGGISGRAETSSGNRRDTSSRWLSSIRARLRRFFIDSMSS